MAFMVVYSSTSAVRNSTEWSWFHRPKLHLTAGFNTIDSRHPDIHDHEVGMNFVSDTNPITAIVGLIDQVVLLERL